MTDVEFRNPKSGSERARRVLVHDYWDVADKARAHPGKWILAFEQAPISVANSIRNGVRALPKDEFQVVTENNTRVPPRTCDIMVRYRPPRKPQL